MAEGGSADPQVQEFSQISGGNPLHDSVQYKPLFHLNDSNYKLVTMLHLQMILKTINDLVGKIMVPIMDWPCRDAFCSEMDMCCLSSCQNALGAPGPVST